jgi:hypothetical protein
MRLLVVSIGIILLLTVVCAAQGPIVLNEIMYNGTGDDDISEFIELRNVSQYGLSIEGWRVRIGTDENHIVQRDSAMRVGLGQYVIILGPDYFTHGDRIYDGIIPDSALVVTIDNTQFGSREMPNSDSTMVALINDRGSIVSSFKYAPGNPEGISVEKINPFGGDGTVNWTRSRVHNGTPGFRNSVTPPDSDLAVLSLWTEPALPNAGDSFQVWIMVKNAGLLETADTLVLRERWGNGAADSLHDVAVWRVSLAAYGDSALFSTRLQLTTQGQLTFIAELTSHDDNMANNVRSLLLTPGGTQVSVVINEIMYQPEPQRAEWVELFNNSAYTWQMEGWQFGDGTSLRDTSRRFALPSTTLGAQDFLILAGDSEIFFETIPEDVTVLIWESRPISLNNTGDSLVLYDAQGNLVDRVDYRPSWGTGMAGISLERISAMVTSEDRTNWASSLDSTGSTPGRNNSRSLKASAGASLLELEPNPFSPDGNGRDDILHIRYHLEQGDSRLDVKIFDVRGREVRRLANNAAAGYSGELLWDGRDGSGRNLPTGLYIFYLEAMGSGGTRKQTTQRAVALARRS